MRFGPSWDELLNGTFARQGSANWNLDRLKRSSVKYAAYLETKLNSAEHFVSVAGKGIFRYQLPQGGQKIRV